MNKKFFAALASATMAFSATGSLAVFAQDFEDETNVVTPGDVRPNPTKLAFNKDNFGALAGIELKDGTVTTGTKVLDTAVFKSGSDEITVTDGKVDTDDLAKVTEIVLPTDFKGEIKGLEYFTGLTTFDDVTVTGQGAGIENEALDFSANTKLATLKVTKASELAEIKLPEPEIKDEKEVYHLTTLDLEGTKLSKLDLSAQEELVKDGTNGSITVKGNKNLKEVTLKVANSAEKAKLNTLDLSGNALETVNLNNYDIATKLDLSGNHIGALNLSKTTAKVATLTGQTFYVYEKAANVNLTEAFADLDVDYVEPATGGKFDKKTGVLDLTPDANTTYTYETKVGGDTPTTTLEVTLKPANPMNRLYNPNSGEHFYTADVKEKEALVALGWNDEGYGWIAPVKATNDKAVYRLYNPNAGDHHYTTEPDEKDTLVAYGWKDEGIGWYSAEDQSHTDVVNVYRQYNPFANGAGSHNYTPDKAENNYLVSLGWIYEGTAWKALK